MLRKLVLSLAGFGLLLAGSVQFMSNTVDLLTVWRPLATIAGGEQAGS